MKRKLSIGLGLLLICLALPAGVLAQTYAFQFERQDVQVYWNADGTVSIDYVFVFNNEPYASPIDYVDVGLPNSDFETSSIFADVDGHPISDISASGYQGGGDSGVAVGLGERAIQPGSSGVVHVFVGTVHNMLRPDSQDDTYASGVFSPTWFDSQFVNGATEINVTYHFPPGVQPGEPRWHEAPSDFPSEPQTAIDQEGRVTYTWSNPAAAGYKQYKFGISFPRQYVPDSAILSPTFWEILGVAPEDVIGLFFCLGFIALFVGIIAAAVAASSRRKLQYLPPRLTIEGHGIKRGLTAIEAAILLEQSLDKVLTMALFAVIKKNAARVTTRDPLKIELISPQPEGLYEYEIDFLKAFETDKQTERSRKLQDMTIALVKSVQAKMKGFSLRETKDYYRQITEKAWAQVEAADTPEVKSQKFDEVMEWTMLDKNYDDRTRRTFTGSPVYIPTWWTHYDPSYTRPSVPVSSSIPSTGSGGLPVLPGSNFAASVVGGVQNFSSKVVGNINDFTSSVTNKTNPVPVATSSSSGSRRSGGGGGCACACACAGCACACAGGGR